MLSPASRGHHHQTFNNYRPITNILQLNDLCDCHVVRTKSRGVRDEHLGSADGAAPVAVSGQVQHFLPLNDRLFNE